MTVEEFLLKHTGLQQVVANHLNITRPTLSRKIDSTFRNYLSDLERQKILQCLEEVKYDIEELESIIYNARVPQKNTFTK